MVMDSDEFSSISSSSLPSYANRIRRSSNVPGMPTWFKILLWVSIVLSLVSALGWIWLFAYRNKLLLGENDARLLAFLEQEFVANKSALAGNYLDASKPVPARAEVKTPNP
jgi:hypothetical protein